MIWNHLGFWLDDLFFVDWRNQAIIAPPITNTINNDTIKTRPIIFVPKNPAFNLRLSTLYLTFPDCRVVCMLRDPAQSVPSMMSYISKIWHVFASPVSKYPRVADLLGFCEMHYLYPLRILRCPNLDDKQWAFLSYHHMLCDLEHSLVEVLDRLYPPYRHDDILYSQDSSAPNDASTTLLMTHHQLSHADISVETNETTADNRTEHELSMSEFRADEKLREFLRVEQIRANSYRGTHLHSVDMCCGGMTEGQLRESLKDVYEAHQWAFAPLQIVN
eukprot:gene27376-36143_t